MFRRSLTLFLWFLLLLLVLLGGLYPTLYFFLDRKFSLLAFKDDTLLQNKLWQIAFYLHIITGGLALLTGWAQFVARFRKRHPRRHRNLGKTYIFLALPAAVSGIYLAGSATGGIVSSLGFSCLGFFWAFTTLGAFKSALKNRILQHRRFALYSYAACFAAVTLRIWLQLFLHLGLDFITAYQVVAWLSWVPNIVFVFIMERKMTGVFPEYTKKDNEL